MRFESNCALCLQWPAEVLIAADGLGAELVFVQLNWFNAFMCLLWFMLVHTYLGHLMKKTLWPKY